MHGQTSIFVFLQNGDRPVSINQKVNEVSSNILILALADPKLSLACAPSYDVNFILANLTRNSCKNYPVLSCHPLRGSLDLEQSVLKRQAAPHLILCLNYYIFPGLNSEIAQKAWKSSIFQKNINISMDLAHWICIL